MNYLGDDPLFTVLLEAAVQRRGILPPRAGSVLRDAARDMADLTVEEQRRAKRKFRKAWRTAARRELAKVAGKSPLHQSSTQKHVHQNIGLGSQIPTRAQKRNRKHAVVHLLRSEASAALEAVTPK
jgi:hypothetical protein